MVLVEVDQNSGHVLSTYSLVGAETIQNIVVRPFHMGPGKKKHVFSCFLVQLTLSYRLLQFIILYFSSVVVRIRPLQS